MKSHETENPRLAQIKETARKTTDAARAALDRVDEEVHVNPWRVVGMVALFSALIGFLFGRRNRRF